MNNTMKSSDSFYEVYLVPFDVYNKLLLTVHNNEKNIIEDVNKSLCPNKQPTINSINSSSTPQSTPSTSHSQDDIPTTTINTSTNKITPSIDTAPIDMSSISFNPENFRTSTPIPPELSQDLNNNFSFSRFDAPTNELENENISNPKSLQNVSFPLPTNSKYKKTNRRRNKHSELMDLMERVRRSCEDGLISSITSQKQPDTKNNNELTEKYNQFVKTLDQAESYLNNLMKNKNFGNAMNYSLPNMSISSSPCEKKLNPIILNNSSPYKIYKKTMTSTPNMLSTSLPHKSYKKNKQKTYGRFQHPSSNQAIKRTRSYTNVSQHSQSPPLKKPLLRINFNDWSDIYNRKKNITSFNTSGSSNLTKKKTKVIGKRKPVISSSSFSPEDISMNTTGSSIIKPKPKVSIKRGRVISSSSSSPEDISYEKNHDKRRKIIKNKNYNLRKRDPALLQKIREQLASFSESSF